MSTAVFCFPDRFWTALHPIAIPGRNSGKNNDEPTEKMRLTVPGPSVNFETTDIYGEPFQLADYQGKGVLLCFFRDAACPFCNFRVYELTRKYATWNRSGLEVVIVFSDTAKQVRDHVARHPRPFRMIADPNLELYSLYGVEQNSSALVRTLLFKVPRIWRGIRTGGRPSKNPHFKIVPADFLIDQDGSLCETWYGEDMSDHMPLKRIQSFVDELTKRAASKLEDQVSRLRRENRKLKKALILLNKRVRQRDTDELSEPGSLTSASRPENLRTH